MADQWIEISRDPQWIFGALSRANNWQWRRLSIDVGGELPWFVLHKQWREMEKGATRHGDVFDVQNTPKTLKMKVGRIITKVKEEKYIKIPS